MRGSLTRLIGRLWTMQLLRFGLVGLFCSAIYAIATGVLISRWSLDPGVASVIGYVVSMPPSFIGQKLFTFRSQGTVASEATRFLVVHGSGLLLSFAIMEATMRLAGGSAATGILATVLITPVLSYLMMAIWVFRIR